MTSSLLDQLTRLNAAPAAPLTDRIYASVVEVEGPEPVGPLFVAYTDRGISFVRPAGERDRFVADFEDYYERPIRPAMRVPRGLAEALRTGRGGRLEYDLRRLTEFERTVLYKALEIPRGETRPYNWIATEIGRHRAVRAVGTALARNPVPFLIPCHRVVRSDGDEGKYYFGPDMKRSLLRAEEVNLEEIHQLAAQGTHYLGSDTTQVVCYPSCHQARRITAPHRVGFRSLDQALATGYRPCGHCRPSVPMSAP
jgi:O-6-methylguanine DNA methyltransferase